MLACLPACLVKETVGHRAPPSCWCAIPPMQSSFLPPPPPPISLSWLLLLQVCWSGSLLAPQQSWQRLAPGVPGCLSPCPSQLALQLLHAVLQSAAHLPHQPASRSGCSSSRHEEPHDHAAGLLTCSGSRWCGSATLVFMPRDLAADGPADRFTSTSSRPLPPSSSSSSAALPPPPP